MTTKHIAPVFAAVLFAAAAGNAQTVPEGELLTFAATPAPPEGFMPAAATAFELEYYGFPPRPDEKSQPALYAAWLRAMQASRQRIEPKMVQTNRFHGPAHLTTSIHDATQTSTNWSGVVDSAGATYFNNTGSFHIVVGEFVVPVARQAYGVCTGGWEYSSSWTGLDGWSTSGVTANDVLQAGVEFDAYCNGPTNLSTYYLWTEWYPKAEQQIFNFPVSPGDDLYISVLDTDATHGTAYVVNMTINQYTTVSLQPKPGISLIGNSAEWITERVTVNGSLSNLVNYTSEYFSNCFADTWGGLTAATAQSPVTFLPGNGLQLTMLDNNGNPISFPTSLGNNAIWLQVEGSAK
jgi:hypothetical protein